MTDIAAWLLERIDAREEGADEIHVRGCGATLPYTMQCDCGEPARVLAECAAKRVTIELHRPVDFWMGYISPPDYQGPACTVCGSPGEAPVHWPCLTVRLLAQSFADQPGFDPAWKL